MTNPSMGGHPAGDPCSKRLGGVLRIPGAVYLFETPQDLGRGAVGLPQHALANERGSLRRRADKYAVATQDMNWRVYRKINHVQTNVRPR